ncbi:MAG: ATP-binding protein [Geitlerinemataceae cyanobacterium]
MNPEISDTNPHSFQAMEEKIKALERENRILKKKLERSYADRQQLEVNTERKENLLRNALEELKASQASLEERQEAIKELKRAQTQLVQTEKMSSLGRLVAGIAHEINNPINFIYGNLQHLQGYTKEMLATVEAYRQCAPEVDEAQLPVDAEEFAFIACDTVQVLQSMQIGATRICDIVSSLRNFSRLDEAKSKEGNIHDGIDNSLMILRYRLESNERRPAIAVQKNYGTLPAIECCHGPLNQVFMNLLANAIDAIDQQEYNDRADRLPEIEIATRTVSEAAIEISVSDNGPGIPENLKSLLFDPFFTTKPIGQGTGLGLAIGHEIVVQQHHGSISVDSDAGWGTTFRIRLPRYPGAPLA